MSAHTSGEWEANRYDEVWSVEVLDGGAATLRVFVASVHDVEDAAKAKANARLIAAAPGLLEALKAEHAKAGFCAEPEICDLAKVIAKAEGRS